MALLTADSNCGVLAKAETCDCQQRASWGNFESLCSNKIKKKCKSFLKKSLYSRLTCHAPRHRRNGGNNQLVGEVQHVSACVASVSQGREADNHWVGTSTGTTKSARLSGIWKTV